MCPAGRKGSAPTSLLASLLSEVTCPFFRYVLKREFRRLVIFIEASRRQPREYSSEDVHGVGDYRAELTCTRFKATDSACRSVCPH